MASKESREIGHAAHVQRKIHQETHQELVVSLVRKNVSRDVGRGHSHPLDVERGLQTMKKLDPGKTQLISPSELTADRSNVSPENNCCPGPSPLAWLP
jgi:hypothetical protein